MPNSFGHYLELAEYDLSRIRRQNYYLSTRVSYDNRKQTKLFSSVIAQIY